MQAILITGKRKQMVFSPETEFEQKLVEMFNQGHKDAEIHLGEYYNCQGGWTREGSSRRDLIIVFDDQSKKS